MTVNIPQLRQLAPHSGYAWRPQHIATLGFAQRAGQVLLIHKKRGLGKGKIIGPGGKCDGAETPAQCVRRELYEEVGIHCLETQARGVLRFYFLDGYALDVHVFSVLRWRGVPMPSEEAAPVWYDENSLPWSRMWEDNRHWLARVLAGESVQAHCVFDQDHLCAGEFVFSASQT